jgi:D-amino peptidase
MKQKILVYTDLEGTPGLDSWDHLGLISPELRAEICARHSRAVARFCQLMLAGGRFTEVLVVEGHPESVVPELLPDGVGFARMHELGPYLPPVDSTWRIAIIGVHGMEGAAPPLAHTSSSKNPQRWFIDGIEVGEVGITAAWAGAHSASLLLVHGTAAACDEAEQVCPGVVTVRVRTADGGNLSEHEEMARIESCCRLINHGDVESRPWQLQPEARIERHFVGRGLDQRLRAAAWLGAWWLISLLRTRRWGTIRCQTALAGADAARTIELIFGGARALLLGAYRQRPLKQRSRGRC